MQLDVCKTKLLHLTLLMMPKLFGGLKDQEMAAAAHSIVWSLLSSNCWRLCPGPPSDRQGAAAVPSDTAHRALTLG